MAKMQSVILSLALMLLTTCGRSEALSCYNCVFLDVDGVSYSDPLCRQAGETPDPMYLVDCADPLTSSGRPTGQNFNFSSYSGIHLAAVPLLNKADVYMGCVSMSATAVSVSGELITLAARGCHYTSQPQFGNCEEKTVARWGAGEDSWSYIVHDYVSELMNLPAETMVDACYCTADECNGSGGSGCSAK